MSRIAPRGGISFQQVTSNGRIVTSTPSAKTIVTLTVRVSSIHLRNVRYNA